MKSKITLCLLVLTFCSLGYSQTPPFIHYATAGNINGEITEIDNPDINNDPNAILMVEKVRIDDNGSTVNNPHFVGVEYDPSNGKWYIFNENSSDTMIENSCYLVYTPPATLGQAFQHLVDVFNIVPGFPNTSEMDNPNVNDDSTSRCKINRGSEGNNNAIEMYYNWMNPGSWNVSTVSGTNIPDGSLYNVMCNPSGFSVVEHESTFDKTDSEVNSITDYSYWTILDDVLLNNNPNALFFVNHRREPSTATIYRSFSIFYNSVIGRWQIHIELENYISDFFFPLGRFFDLFIWNGTLDVDEVETPETVSLYPNPFDSNFTIKVKETISSVSIFNALGQNIYNFNGEGKNQLNINMDKYPDGYYFAKVQVEGAIKTVKIIKN